MTARLSLGGGLVMRSVPLDLTSEVTASLPAANGGTAQTAYQQRQLLLASKIAANMNSTADQAMTMAAGLTKYVIRRIVATNASTNLTTAVGGLYTAASKGGTVIVADSQVYSALSASGKFVDLTLAAGVTGDVVTSTQLYFALTIAQGATATADIYIFGDDLS